jgi:sec-independent protein translocase protein TatA
MPTAGDLLVCGCQESQEGSMGEGLFQPMHLLLILGIALIIFGPKRLPELGRGLGASIRGFKDALEEHHDAGDDLTKPK